MVWETIQISNAIDTEAKFIIEKYKDTYYLMHEEIRNKFKKWVLAALIKHIYGFDMCRIRCRSINKLK